ncbi:MAG: PhzF family phenazine biosynthesis protein [Pseudomonadota bacterium]|nr:PhzF family phenazine biosynthesis protein [Pseudomonadota bacterium]
MTLPITHVDVFSDTALCGNPVAVVHDADGLSEERMQLFARWTNLSETTFLLRPTVPEADYRVRIFTPGAELPFAGHPTLGTCQAWLHRLGQTGTKREVIQQCQAGLIRIRVNGTQAAFAAPPLLTDSPDEDVLTPVLAALGLGRSKVLAASWLDNGTKWLGLQLDASQTVLDIEPDHALLAALCKVGVIGRTAAGSDVLFEVRAFAASIGVPEDPVTGSLNAGFAVWMASRGETPPSYRVAQGTRLGRLGRLGIDREGETIWVGGNTSICITGSAEL